MIRKANIYCKENISEKEVNTIFKNFLNDLSQIKLLKTKSNIARIEFDEKDLNLVYKAFREADFVEVIDLDPPGCSLEFYDAELAENQKYKKAIKIDKPLDIEKDAYLEELRQKMEKYL